MRAIQVFEVVAGVFCGFAVAGFASVLASGIAYLIMNPFYGPFLVGGR